MTRRTSRKLIVTLAIIGIALSAPMAVAQHGHAGGAHMDQGTKEGHSESMTGHSHDMAAMHGGDVAMTGEFHFETVFTERGIRVYPYNMKQEPIAAKGMAGTVLVQRKGEKGSKEVPLKWMAASKDSVEMFRNKSRMMETQDYLFAPYDFINVTDGDVKVDITVKNLGGKSEKEATFRETFKMTPMHGMACPMHPEQASFVDGKCSICGGMALQPAAVMFGCCPGCPEMHATVPTTCPKCGMEMTMRSVNLNGDEPKSDKGHAGHNH